MNAPTLTRRSFTKGVGGLVLAFSLDPAELLAQGAAARLPGSLNNNRRLDEWVRIGGVKYAADGCKWTGDFIVPNNYATVTADKVDTLAADNVTAAKALAKAWTDKWSCTK